MITVAVSTTATNRPEVDAMKRSSFAGAATLALAAMMASAGSAQDAGSDSGDAGWAGFYAGLQGHHNSTDFQWSEALGAGDFDGSIRSTGLGLFAGYNYQKGQYVFGIEAEANQYSGDAAFTGVPGPTDLVAEPDRDFAIRGRVGYDLGNVLPYVAIGYSWLDLDTNAPGFSSADRRHDGGVIGLGADIAMTGGLFARVEYEHSMLSTERYEYCGPACAANIDLGKDSFRLGLGLRF